MSPGSNTFVDKWLAAEPWHRLLLIFEAASVRTARQLLESIGYELRSAALDSSDPRVSAGKLGWWAEEWRLLANGTPRHPLTTALRALDGNRVDPGAGAAWAHAAMKLADDASDADLHARVERWLPFARAQGAAASPWLAAPGTEQRDTGPDDAIAEVHALSLAGERLIHLRADLARGRLPVPLSALARHRLDRSGFARGEGGAHAVLADHSAELVHNLDRAIQAAPGGYRRVQAALARLRATRLQAHPGDGWHGRIALPPLRAALAAWRASRRA